MAMLDLRDVHVGELVTAEETGGLNAYDLEECRRRASRLVEGALRALRNHPIRVLYYGVDRATREWGQTIGRAVDYVHLGHFHRAAQIQTPPGEQLVSGSWVGATAYTLRQFREAVAPRQHLYLFDRDGLRCTYRLDLASRAVLAPDERGFYVPGGAANDS